MKDLGILSEKIFQFLQGYASKLIIIIKSLTYKYIPALFLLLLLLSLALPSDTTIIITIIMITIATRTTMTIILLNILFL